MKIKYKTGYKHQLEAGHARRLQILGANRSRQFNRVAESLLDNIETDYIRIINGTLYIKKGYAWDGITGISIGLKCLKRASLEHDAYYQLMRQGLLPQSFRHLADKDFARQARIDGLIWPLTSIAFLLVRLFGKPFASKVSRKPVHTAP